MHSILIHDPVWTDALISAFSLYSVSKLDTFENEINYAYEMMNTLFVSACRQNKFRNIVASEEGRTPQSQPSLIEYLNK